MFQIKESLLVIINFMLPGNFQN